MLRTMKVELMGSWHQPIGPNDQGEDRRKGYLNTVHDKPPRGQRKTEVVFFCQPSVISVYIQY